ncbi:MAG: glycosyltransferase [Candidatus Omnitrophica bacterium]|nr:glycosyltransferase [Candidatus Omnitrophota bacterium]
MIEVSVIITTKNEEKHIRNCLQSIMNQDFDQSRIENIVVDNDSTDNTKVIAKEFTENVYDFGPERSAQRNFGVSRSNGKYILYLDADMILAENVIGECVEKCEKENLIALYIPERIVNLPSDQSFNQCNQVCNLCNHLPKPGFWNKVRNFERSFYDATDIDCVRFVARDVFNKLNGFDESLTGPEDWDFDRRAKELGKTDIIRASLSHNEGQFRLFPYLAKKSYYSAAFISYIHKWGRNDRIIKKQLGLAYRFFGVFFENGKWKKLMMHPVLTLGMYFLRGLVGAVFLSQKARNKKCIT